MGLKPHKSHNQSKTKPEAQTGCRGGGVRCMLGMGMGIDKVNAQDQYSHTTRASFSAVDALATVLPGAHTAGKQGPCV